MIGNFGTDVLLTHNLRQGEGLATTLGPQTSDDYAIRYAEARRAAKEQQIAARAAKRNAALQKMMTQVPDFFYRHKQEIDQAWKKVFDLGVEAMNSGVVDPYEGTDEKSIAFQRAANDLKIRATVSTQIKDQYKAMQQDVQAKGADFFNPQDLIDGEGYFSRSLQDHLDNPTGVPLVRQRKPMQSSIQIASGLAAELNKGIKVGDTVDPNVARETIRTAFRDPVNGRDIATTFTGALENLTDDERAKLENEARQNGLSVPEMYAYQTMNAFLKRPGAYSINNALAEGDKLFKPSTTAYRGKETYGKSVDKRTSMASAMSVARGILLDDPRALGEFAAAYKLKQDPSETEEEFFGEVQRSLATDLYNRSAKDRESGVIAEGQSAKELEVSTDKWLQDLKSGKRQLAQEAAGVLQGGTYYGNMYISKAQTLPASEIQWTGEAPPFDLSVGDMENANILRLDLRTPVGTSITRDQFSDDPSAVEIVEKQGSAEVYINLSKLEPNDQMLRTLYQSAHKKTGTVYKGPGYTPENMTIEEILTIGKNPPTKTFNF